MKDIISLELKDFQTIETGWSKEFLKNACLAHSMVGTIENKEMYLETIKKKFFDSFSDIILARLANVPKITSAVSMKLSSGKFETLLDRICNAVYRHYVTLKGNAAVVVVGKNHLEKLNISPARFIQYSRETIPYLNDIAEIKVYHDGPKIILKFFLKEL